MVEKFKQLSLIVLLVEIIFSSDLYAQSFKEKLKQAVKQEYNSAKQRYNSRNQYRNNSYRYNNNSKQYQNNSIQYNSKNKQKDSNNIENKAKSQDEAVLTVFGFGKTKDEATRKALRSAIEQAFGAFVSSNTQLLNDSLVSDEIATVSSGNIKHYEYISEQKYENGYSVSLKATVSINKLIHYAESKGSEIEFGGDTFAMNIAMYELNKNNEASVINHVFQEVVNQIPHLYEYKLSSSNPQKNEDGKWEIPISVTVYTNNSTQDLLLDKLNAIALTKDEYNEYKNIGLGNGTILSLTEESSDTETVFEMKRKTITEPDNMGFGGTIEKTTFEKIPKTVFKTYKKQYYFRNDEELFIRFTNSLIIEAIYQTIAFKITDSLKEYSINIAKKSDFYDVFSKSASVNGTVYKSAYKLSNKYCDSSLRIDEYNINPFDWFVNKQEILFSQLLMKRSKSEVAKFKMSLIYNSLDEIKRIKKINIIPTHKSFVELKDEQ